MNIEQQKSRFYDFGRFRLDASERVLFESGEPVNLPPKVFDTLFALVRKSGHIVERDTLMLEVWADTFVEEANISVNISALRKMLGKTDEGKDFIETVARRGYRFRAKVLTQNDEFGVEGEDQTLIIHRRLQARIVQTEVAGADEKIISGAENQKTLAATNEIIKTLAVLPFRLIKAETGDEYLSLSLADALITQLGNTSKIVVRPTSAIKKFAALEQNSVEAGRELQVDAVLECGVYRIADRLRVMALMLKTATGNSLWSEKFDVEFKDIFDVQDAIAEQVARALTLRLNEQERELLTKRYTTSSEAFREYLKGRYFWNKRDVGNFYKAISHFKKAIDFDPTYALAYAGLADAYNMLMIWGELAPQEGYVLAKAAALKALEIDAKIAEAYASLGYTKYLYEWDFDAAENFYKKALELNPNCVPARSWYAKLCVTLRRFDEAEKQMRRAYEVDPLSPVVSASRAAVLLYSEHYDEAIAKYLKLLDANPNFVPALLSLGIAYGQKRMKREAIAAHEAAAEHSAGNLPVASYLAGTRAIFGDRENALETINELKEKLSQDVSLTFFIALIYARLNDKNEAFEWLETAYENRVGHLVDLLYAPEFDNLRGDVRFDDLLRRVGLLN